MPSPSVLIVGAGVIGCSIADALAVRGVSVTVLDMRAPGLGASQASAGVLAPWIEAHEGDPLLRLGARSLSMFDAFVAGLGERSRVPVAYAPSGTLEMALSESDQERLRAAADGLTRAGVAHEWVDPSGIRRIEPAAATTARGALLIPAHGFIAVAGLIRALADSARLAGATFESPVEAISVAPTSSGVDVRAGDRRYSAGHVVVAAGSWSGRLKIAGMPRLSVRPIRGQLLHLKWAAADFPRRVVWGPRCYTVPWSDRSLLVGATVEDVGFDEDSTVDGVSGLLTAVRDLLPEAGSASLEAVRVGLRPATADGLPLIGPSPVSPRVILATGHYRNGILLAPLTAAMVAEGIVNASWGEFASTTDPGRIAS